MSKASTETLLSLEQYAEILGADPWHWQGLECAPHPIRVDVTDVMFRYSWQDTMHAGYEEVALAIATAEARIANFIGFWPAPKYIEQETVEWPRFNTFGFDYTVTSYNANNVLNRYKTVHCAWKKFIRGGRRRVVLIEEDVDVEYDDLDNDGFNEWATITVTGVDTTGWLPKEIAVYPGTNTAPTERIRGFRVTVEDDTVTIEGMAALLVDPAQWELVSDGRAINGDDSDVYLESVNVYREYCSDEGIDFAPLVLLYQNSSVSPMSAFETSYGLLQPYNKERSIVSLVRASWDTDTQTWVPETCSGAYATPNLVQMYYQAGIDTDAQRRMQPLLARAVAALATALITKPVVCHGPPENLQHFWQTTPGEKELTYSMLGCPWGTRNGALEAYNLVRDLFPEGIGTASV